MAFIIQSNVEINKEDVLSIRELVYEHERKCIKNYDVKSIIFNFLPYKNYIITPKGFDDTTSCWWVEVISRDVSNKTIRYAYEANPLLGIDITRPLVRPILNTYQD